MSWRALAALLLAGAALAAPGVCPGQPPAEGGETETQSESAEAAGPAAEQASAQPAATAAARELLAKPSQLPDKQQTQQTLKEVLARPEFAAGQRYADGGKNWLERLLDWLNDLWQGAGVITPGPLSTVVLSLLAVVIAALAIRLVWAAFARRPALPPAGGESGRQLSVDELLHRTQQAVAQGDYRTAVRLRFVALLRGLGLTASAVQTNWQLARHVGRERPAAEAPFRQLVSFFEDAWYGAQPCAAETYARADELARAVLSAYHETEGRP